MDNLVAPGLVNPTIWSTETLVSLGDHVIHELALNSVGIDTAYRVTLGRCLLAVEKTKLYQRLGCSGAVHYGTSRLGIGVKHARTVRRVAQALERLPRLSCAAEKGEISWGKLREIVSKASVETEGTWLELARSHSYSQIERLVRATEEGKLPWEQATELEPETRVRLHFTHQTGEVFERARTLMSERLEKPVSVTEALEHLSLEFVAGKKLTAEKIKNAKIEAQRGVRAAKRRDARLVTQAKEIYETENQEALLSQALGAPPLDEEALNCDVPHGTSHDIPGETSHDEPNPVATSSDTSDAPRSDEHDDPHGTPRHQHSTQRHHRYQPEQLSLASKTRPPMSREHTLAPKQPTPASGKHTLTPEQPTLASGKLTLAPKQPTPATGKQAIAAAMRAAKTEPKGEDWQNPRLRFNPKARSATPAQRREILRRDGYCCSTPGCPNRHWLQLHHLVAVSCGGETAPSNLIALCSRCHKNYHDGHLLIEATPDGQCIFKNTQGHDLARETRIEVAGWINFWFGWEGEAEDCYIRRWAMAA